MLTGGYLRMVTSMVTPSGSSPERRAHVLTGLRQSPLCRARGRLALAKECGDLHRGWGQDRAGRQELVRGFPLASADPVVLPVQA